jgi:hypothetical protein
MIGVDDGIWQGHFDFADVLFLIAAVVFLVAAIRPHLTRSTDVARADWGVSLFPLGLALVAVAWLIL